VRELEAGLRGGRARIVAAAWTIVVSLVAAALAASCLGGAVWSSGIASAAYLIAATTFLRFAGPASMAVVGREGAWPALFAAFWSGALAMIAVAAGRIDTPWLANATATGGGAFVGLMYMGLRPAFMSRHDAWLMAALPLGGFAAWSAAGVQRGFDLTVAFAWPEAFVGTMAASVFIVPLAVVGTMLSSRASGLAKIATLYLHNPHFTAKAIACLDEAIALSPRSADFYNLRGVAHSKAGDGGRADADFKKVTELSPRAAEAHMNRGVDFLRQGEFDRAVDALRQATVINPTLATAFSNLGTAYQRKGDLDAAIVHYGMAIGLRPRYPVALANRSYSHFLKGRHDLAMADARQALHLDPRLAMAHANLGHAQAASGDRTEAIRSYRRALALSPDPAVEQETREALAKLGVHDLDEDAEEDGVGFRP
jgi:Flp pilus assembly protein TadD